jgi:hypothetical protein
MSMRARYVSGDEAKLNRMAFGKKISRLVSGCAIARDQMRGCPHADHCEHKHTRAFRFPLPYSVSE